jgi:hypothetical protein
LGQSPGLLPAFFAPPPGLVLDTGGLFIVLSLKMND